MAKSKAFEEGYAAGKMDALKAAAKWCKEQYEENTSFQETGPWAFRRAWRYFNRLINEKSTK